MLGTPYFNTPKATGDFFGPLPLANLKLAPTDTFSVQGGKLPTLIGAEYTFTFQNMNIERGPLWNQEPAISRGGQLNYTAGPVAFAFSLNDGFYSNRYTWLSGSAAYTLDNSNNFMFAAGGNYAHSTKVTTTTPFNQTTATPLFQNNETILNCCLYLQCCAVDYNTLFPVHPCPCRIRRSPFNIYRRIDLWRGDIGQLQFPEDSPSPGFSLPVRFEYISSTGSTANGAPRPDLWPRQQRVVGHPDPDLSVQDLLRARRVLPRRNEQHDARIRARPGRFGNTTQTRFMFETGVLF